MKKVLIVQAAAGPDYMADHVSHWLYFSQNELEMYTNRHPEYLFDDYSENVLSGNGFTVFRKIPAVQKNGVTALSDEVILGHIKERKYDVVIWTSIRRCSDFLINCLESGYDRDRLITVDGEDDQHLVGFANGEILSSRTKYYKRELSDDKALPISFKFPSCHPVLNAPFPKKSKLLANCDPRFRGSYIQSVTNGNINYVYTTEESYYQQYQESLFAFTTKKSGWDCMRHYEILACNCLPVFSEFDKMPSMTMTEWDRDLQSKVNELWLMMSQTSARIDIEQYMPTWNHLMNEFRNIFNTKMKTEHFKNVFAINI